MFLLSSVRLLFAELLQGLECLWPAVAEHAFPVRRGNHFDVQFCAAILFNEGVTLGGTDPTFGDIALSVFFPMRIKSSNVIREYRIVRSEFSKVGEGAALPWRKEFHICALFPLALVIGTRPCSINPFLVGLRSKHGPPNLLLGRINDG